MWVRRFTGSPTPICSYIVGTRPSGSSPSCGGHTAWATSGSGSTARRPSPPTTSHPSTAGRCRRGVAPAAPRPRCTRCTRPAPSRPSSMAVRGSGGASASRRQGARPPPAAVPPLLARATTTHRGRPACSMTTPRRAAGALRRAASSEEEAPRWALKSSVAALRQRLDCTCGLLHQRASVPPTRLQVARSVGDPPAHAIAGTGDPQRCGASTRMTSTHVLRWSGQLIPPLNLRYDAGVRPAIRHV
mmetsp:Transcript_138676/g.386733  ORF Transcript_138676/g.386733 Transcript_138676/m.386733 type:complete len:245 (+) Transcript_138676:587-1321(+)